jgi:DMSO reductase anchor subunit
MKFIYSIFAYLLFALPAEASQTSDSKHQTTIASFSILSKKLTSIHSIEKDSVPAMTTISAEEQQKYKQTTKLFAWSAFSFVLGLACTFFLFSLGGECVAILFLAPWLIFSIIGGVLFVRAWKKLRKSKRNWGSARKHNLGVQIFLAVILFLASLFFISKTEGCGD